jgi:hypothetical protein
MWLNNHGALVARRWGRILCVGVASCGVVACATTSESRNPPSTCSRSDARPANPYGSVLSAPVVSTAPQGDVMVFPKEGDAGKADGPDGAVVPAPPPAPDQPAPGQPLSMMQAPTIPQLAYRSC